MHEGAESVSTQPSRPGIIGSFLSSISRIITFLLSALSCSLIIEWIGIAFFWPELGAEHSRIMMKTELGWFSKDFTQSLLSSEPVEHMMIILNTVNQWLFIETGFNRFINQTQDAVKEKTLKVQIYFWCKEYVFAAIYMISTFTLRLVIFLLSMPLFLLAITIGVVDGLVRRDLRKYGCGYESGFIYHQSKVMIIKPLIASGMLYLALPFSIHPLVILLPSAVFQGISISITVGSFKKYI